MTDLVIVLVGGFILGVLFGWKATQVSMEMKFHRFLQRMAQQDRKTVDAFIAAAKRMSR